MTVIESVVGRQVFDLEEVAQPLRSTSGSQMGLSAERPCRLEHLQAVRAHMNCATQILTGSADSASKQRSCT